MLPFISVFKNICITGNISFCDGIMNWHLFPNRNKLKDVIDFLMSWREQKNGWEPTNLAGHLGVSLLSLRTAHGTWQGSCTCSAFCRASCFQSGHASGSTFEKYLVTSTGFPARNWQWCWKTWGSHLKDNNIQVFSHLLLICMAER